MVWSRHLPIITIISWSYRSSASHWDGWWWKLMLTVDDDCDDDDDDGDDDDSDDDKQWWAVALIETDDRPEAEWRRPRRDGPDENQTLKRSCTLWVWAFRAMYNYLSRQFISDIIGEVQLWGNFQCLKTNNNSQDVVVPSRTNSSMSPSPARLPSCPIWLSLPILLGPGLLLPASISPEGTGRLLSSQQRTSGAGGSQ